MQSTQVQIALLGPSPIQQVLSDTKSKEFKKEKTEVHTLPIIRPTAN
jgi:hypothetical protein